jgi:Tfp pilus assembly protein PilE
MLKIYKSKNKNKKNGPSLQAGYALLELLFYLAFFSLLTIIVINALITMVQSFKETEVQTELIRSGSIMERMSREVRGALSISTLSANDLKLNTTDSAGTAKTVEFALSGSNVRLLENGVFTGNLNSPNISVTGLTFTEITTTEGKGVKIVLTVQSLSDKYSRSVDFYDTVVLRGGY